VEDAEEDIEFLGSGLWSALGNEFNRIANIGDFLHQQGSRTVDDARCFFPRTWYHLKRLE
jgi:hypothetical protein